MPLQKIDALLGASDELKTLSARTRRLRDLQTLYFRSAPRELAMSSRVKNCRAGTLVVTADNAAVAAKLKQLAPTLLASIHETEAEITALRIEVQVGGFARERAAARTEKTLDSKALHEFAGLSERLKDGALKSALKNLVRRHKRPKPG